MKPGALFPEVEETGVALFSQDKTYRYFLSRIWNSNLPILGALMLNPSTADAVKDDPTIHRMGERARQLGYGSLYVCNLFAYRSTNPEELYRVQNPVGSENDSFIIRYMGQCKLVICGWGRDGTYQNRDEHVLALLHSAGIAPHALAVNSDGTPQHPLYLAYSIKPQPYERKVALA